MKLFIMLSLLIGIEVYASEPPANYPVVNGIVRKVDHETMRLTIRHEEIPNLDMPGMTMVFKVKEHSLMTGLAVDDKISFVSDKLNGEIIVLWIKKNMLTNAGALAIYCAEVAAMNDSSVECSFE